MNIKLILGSAGTTISLLCSIIPCYSIYERKKENTLLQVPINFLKISHLCQVSWLIYSITTLDVSLIVVNSLTTFLSYICIIFYAYSTEKLLAFQIEYFLGLVLTVAICYSMWMLNSLGLYCAILSIFSSLANLECVPKVLKTSDCNYIDPKMNSAYFINGAVWLAYGLAIKDANVFISSFVFASVSIMLIILHLFFRLLKKEKGYFEI